jgi:outer membrane protein OmpA-like peptidoglycan-associated protein/uncharacterized protein YhjY with autotransporter beta-barrel domain
MMKMAVLEKWRQTMKVRQNLMLCGVSIVAMGMALPALAQTVPINGGMLLPNPFVTLSTDVTVGGVTTVGSAPSAQVVDLSTGEAAQVSETAVPVSLTNGGSTSITADASGTGPAIAAVGNVAPDVPGTTSFQSAFTQKHLLGDVEGETWDASATLLNTGSLQVRANAMSTDGDATATVTGGIAQKASVETKGRTATAVMNNQGSASVSATASGAGTIKASIGTGGETGAPGILQFVFSSKSPTETTLGSGTLLNSGTISLSATAAPLAANAVSADASVTGGVKQQVQATGRGNSNLTAAITNSNAMSFSAVAGVGSGSALTSTAFATEVLTQRIQANGGGLQSDSVDDWNDRATVTMTNAGSVNLSTNAVATGSATSLIGVKSTFADFADYSTLYGSTYGAGLNEDYLNFRVPSPILSEHGVISQRGQANGWGNDGSDVAFTNAAGAAINVASSATATSVAGLASARNAAAGLIVQKTQANGTGNDTVTAVLTNAGRIGATAAAVASSAAGDATAVSTLTGAVQQTAEATGPTKFALDTGGGDGGAGGGGGGGGGEAAIVALAADEGGSGGEPEFGFYTNIGELTFTNAATGVVDVRTSASAAATGGNGEAHAYVDPAVSQAAQVDGGTPKAVVDNRNTITVAATSLASGTRAFATAGTAGLVLDAGFPVDEGRLPTAHDVVGISQTLVGKATDARFANSGTLGVAASATATGGSGGAGAIAAARGYHVTGEPVGITVANSGTVTVLATATATAAADTARLARADATGMGFYANYASLAEIPELVKDKGGDSGNGQNGHPPGDEEEEPDIPTYALTGSVANAASGSIVATARSTGDAQLPDGDLTLPASVVPGQALSVGSNAVGVDFLSASNAATVQNAGTIEASAITTGAPASAYGVRVGYYDNSFGVVAAGTEVFTLNNVGGTIRARVSTDNGTTYQRGTAIDTSNAPNPSVINLEGAAGRNGVIYGDIRIAATDAINVRNGETRLDGVINPYVESPEPPPEEVTAFAAAAAPAGPLVGSLSIASGGTLYLVDQPNGNASYSGPAGANVETFSIASGGKLALQLPTNSNPAIAQAAYPVINAGNANLGGSLELRLSTQNGLYGNSYVYNDVIDADTRNGTFASVATSTPSPLLAVSAVYDANANVDLNITRNAFDSVPGLTVNQAATGGGIENVYSPNLTGPFGGLVATLFTLDADAYPDALDQLSGDQYAGYLQGLRNYSLQTNGMVSDQLDCAISIDGPQKCRARDGEVRVWALGNYNDVSVDTDINAPGYSGQNWSVLLGVDYTTGNFTFGAFGGYRDTTMDFTRGAGRIEADGWQIGGVAAYDTGSFYVRGIGSYSGLNGQSTRSIAIGAFAGAITGEPDANVTSIYGEAGARFDVGKTWLTPFVALDYTSVGLPAFTETGVPGANLGFEGQSENQTSLLLGLKWAGNFGGIIPEAKVAWRYDLNNTLFGVDPYFADAPAGSTYRVFAPTTDTSSVVVGVSLAAALGKQATGRIGYQGRYNNQVTDNAFYGSLTIAFGHAPAPVPAPPPPPPPAPAPLPPCPPSAVTPGPFLVFFDWDKSLITAEAAQILERAAEQYAATGQTRVEIAGHTDTSGTATYNMALGQRRADAVRAYLATKGVPEGAMVTQSFGETRLLVETADGVREPQNRRAEITFSGAAAPATGPCTPQ